MSTTPDSSARRRAPARLIEGLFVPPDFYPERQIDATTWAEALFEPFALIGAVVCFLLGVVQLGQSVAPEWPTRFLVPLGIVVGLEAFLYSRRLSRGSVHFKEWLVLLAPVIVLARLLPYFDDPTSSLLGDLAAWLVHPSAILSFGFAVDGILLLIVWGIVFGCTQLLNQLRIQPGEIVEAKNYLSRYAYEDSIRAIDHGAPLRQLGDVFVWGGVILVLVSSFAALGTSQFLSLEAVGQIIGFERPSLHLVQLNVVLYFVLGLLLVGEAHFVRQRTLWRLDRIAVPPEIPARWVTGVVALVGVAIVVAFLLPTSYAMTLGDLISYLFAIVATIVITIGGAIFALLFLILSLFRGSGEQSAASPPMARPTVLPPAPEPGGASPLDTIRSIVFWIVVVGIVAYSLSVLWRRRPAWLSQLRFARVLLFPWRILSAIFRFGRRVGRDVGRAITTLVPLIFRSANVAPPRPRSFISLSRLGPRELVEYFYLSVCERAARLGHPRAPDVTPAEYERQLHQALPLVDPEIEVLTAAFLEARYGPRPTTTQQVRSVRAGWETLKKKLRGARLSRQSSRQSDRSRSTDTPRG